MRDKGKPTMNKALKYTRIIEPHLRETLSKLKSLLVFVWPALEKALIASFYILKVLILPITAMVITILTQTVVGNIMLIALAAWFAKQIKFDMGDYVGESLHETCIDNSTGSLTDLFECIGKGFDMIF